MNFNNITTDEGRKRLKQIADRMVQIDRNRRYQVHETSRLNKEALAIIPEGDHYYQWHNGVHQRIMAEAKLEHDIREEEKNANSL